MRSPDWGGCRGGWLDVLDGRFSREVGEDFKAHLQGRRSLSSRLGQVVFGRGFHVLLSYRIQRRLGRFPLLGHALAKVIWYVTCSLYGCEISARAKLAGGLYIPHPLGIVIGEGVEIASGAVIYQQVTIGRGFAGDGAYPRLGGGVHLGAGCKVLGAVTLGAGSVVGANAVVVRDVPPGCVAVGVPAVNKERHPA